MDKLTSGQLSALRNLAAKQSATITPFVNIADARHLTDLGLASRSRQGWDITAAGLAHLGDLERPCANDGASVTELHALRKNDCDDDGE